MKLRMPTLPGKGEGRVVQGSNRQAHLNRSAGVMSTACPEGDVGNWGRPARGGVRNSNGIVSDDDQQRESERVTVTWKPGNAGGAKGPYF